MFKDTLKSATRQVLAGGYYASRHYLNLLKGKVIILMYHRVLPREAFPREQVIQPGMYVYSDAFMMQMRFLKKYFHLLSFTELLALWKEKDWDSDKRYCVVTFDDGWLDNYLYAFPILQQYKIPATVFLPTALIGTHQWFWPDKLAYLLKYYLTNITGEKENQLRCVRNQYSWLSGLREGKGKTDIDTVIEMWKDRTQGEIDSLLEGMSQALGVELPSERVLVDWKEVEEMSKHRISFGSHSCTHKIFTTLSLPEVRKEVTDSLDVLRDKSINFIPVLAYPNGNYSREVIDQVKTAGYQAAVSTRFGYEEHAPANLFSIKRIGIHQDISATLPLFSFHIAGGNHFLANLL